jgi:hypothetical protein
MAFQEQLASLNSEDIIEGDRASANAPLFFRQLE